MDIILQLKSKETGIISSVLFPIDEEDIRERFELKVNSPMEFIVLEDGSKLFGEVETYETLNDFAEMVEDVDDDLVEAVREFLGYDAKDFVVYDFKFEDCSLLPDVNNERELGEYWVDELGFSNIPREILEFYFDYEGYGREINLENPGGFSSKGYVDIRCL